MFIGRYIEDRKYYDYLKKIYSFDFICFISASIFMIIILLGLLFDFDTSNILAIYFVVYIIFDYFKIRKYKKCIKFVNNAIVEIDDDFIKIKTKNNTDLEQKIDLNTVDKIYVKKDYFLFDLDKIKNLLSLKFNKHPEHYIIVESGGKKKRIDFIFDSYYMVEELKKIINQWERKGYNLSLI
ncbi:MAG TPA: hypothetical protein ENI82_02995 [Bacteroidetes bacterium]|nr:hypothetical protein [Bacteroidota bacterium]